VPAATRRLMAPNASKTECLLFMVITPSTLWTNDSDMMIVEILGNPLAPRIEGINQLVRPQLVQQLEAAVFDQASVHGGNRLACRSSVNGFAELDKLCGLNRKIWHDRPPYDGRTRSDGRNEKESVVLSRRPMGKDTGLAS